MFAKATVGGEGVEAQQYSTQFILSGRLFPIDTPFYSFDREISIVKHLIFLPRSPSKKGFKKSSSSTSPNLLPEVAA